LRDTTNEENGWEPSELEAIDFNSKGATNKVATQLNPVIFPEDDIFGYMKAGGNEKDDEGKKIKAESIQRTTAFKSSVLKGIPNMYAFTTDDGTVFPKNGSPLRYSTQFYSTHLEGFFNLEYYRLGVYDNIGSHRELSSELVEKHKNLLNESELGGKFKRYELKSAEQVRKTNAAGLLKGLAFLRGGAKQAAFGSDVSPKVLILAGLESANPIFNNLFVGTGEKPALNIELLQQLANDYKNKLATPIYVGIRKGYLQNEDEVQAIGDGFVVDSPIAVVNQFNQKYLSNE
jgi:CRISPR-associated protein Cst2